MSTATTCRALLAVGLACGAVDAQELAFGEGRIAELVVLDLDRDGNDELIAVGRRGSDRDTRRVVRVWPGGPAGPLTERAADTLAAPSWTAIAFADWAAPVGVELLALEPDGLRAHPLDPTAPEGVLRFHPQGRTLFAARTYFDRPARDALPLWPLLGTDADGVARDAWVPLARGYARLERTHGGRARAVDTVDLAPYMVTRRVYDDSLFSVVRELPFPTLIDVDGDGGTDLVFEDIRGRELLRLAARRDTDGAWRWDGPIAALDDRDQDARVEDTRIQKTFRRLLDLDGDGHVDLVVWRILGDLAGSMKFETQVSVLGGRIAEGSAVHFAPRSRMEFEGLASVAALADLNGDGRGDLVIVRTDPASFLGRSIAARYAVYLQRDDALFPEQPSFEHAHTIPSDALTEADLRVGRLPPAFDLSRDFDGDGVHDLLLVTAGQGFEVRRGRIERRTHDGRVWDVLAFDDPPWARAAFDASFRFALARFSGGRVRALVFALDDRLHVVPLP